MKLSTQVLVSVTLIALFATPSADGVLFWSWKKSSLLYFKRCWLSYDSKFCKGSASIHPQDNGGSDSLGMGTYPIVPIDTRHNEGRTTTPPPTCPPYSEINFLHLFNFGTKLEEELALTTLTDSPSQNRIDKTISDLCLLTSFQCTTNSDCGQGRLCCAANAPSNSFKDTFDYSLDYYEHEDDVTEGPIIDEIKSRFCKICIFPH
ncbi:hypothetical protein TCAL_02408 [Tigriopus californicus]|uniref:WAP domain-containing protein n=1 Tax=Tigriopus californicus TaxID=6832 RepID=A0A553P046_TIGCA|nr:hypothetical protein TCAL_02408 [Tigriopus californicus]